MSFIIVSSLQKRLFSLEASSSGSLLHSTDLSADYLSRFPIPIPNRGEAKRRRSARGRNDHKDALVRPHPKGGGRLMGGGIDGRSKFLQDSKMRFVLNEFQMKERASARAPILRPDR